MNNILKKQKDLLEDKEALLAMVAHDLKNPVSSGILALKLLENNKLSPLNPYQKEILDNIMVGFKYMKNLVENVLYKYKFDNKAYLINKIPTDFIKLTEDVINESRYLFQERGQTVRFNSNLRNTTINVDVLQIARVMNNLFVNASKYSPKGSEIAIEVFKSEKGITFSVENTGKGISLANPNEVFEKFISCSIDSKTVATGLGLFIAKNIIKAHNGEIFIESVVNKFTRVTFTLPVK